MAPSPIRNARPLTFLVAAVLVLTFAGVASTSLRTSSSPASWPTLAGGIANRLPATPATGAHYGEPISPDSQSAPGGLEPFHPALSPSVPPWNCTGVNYTASLDPGIPELGVNFTVATTPATNSGAAPLAFTWNISYGGGGLPPYHAWVTLTTASLALTSFNSTGNDTLSQAGIWNVEVQVEDSTCTQISAAFFTVFAWDPAVGPNPLAVNATPTTATVPANVTYTAATVSIPAGWTFFWTGIGFYPYEPGENYTYYFPGTYNATACLVEADGTAYACATSPNVNVTGTSPILTSTTVTPGPYPVQVTFSANLTGSAAFPNGTVFDLTAWNGTSEYSARSNGISLSVTEPVGCGFPWSIWEVPTGNCTESATFVVNAPMGPPARNSFYESVISVNLSANSSPVNWWPSVSYSYSPSNGTAPLNLSVNVTARYGAAPYDIGWVADGDSGSGPNSTLYNETYGSVLGWNGTLRTVTITLPIVGYYWVAFSVTTTSEFGYVQFALPLIVVGNATVPAFAPLVVRASETNATGTSPGNASTGDPVQFLATPGGGDGPYTIQWSFGDGQFAGSVPGVAIQHTYSTAGTFVPTVTVTDDRGTEVIATLPAIVVAGPARSGTGPGGPGTSNGSGTTVSPPPKGGASVPWYNAGAAQEILVVLAAAFIIAGLLLSRREYGREGEALVAGVEPPSSTGSGPPRR